MNQNQTRIFNLNIIIQLKLWIPICNDVKINNLFLYLYNRKVLFVTGIAIRTNGTTDQVEVEEAEVEVGSRKTTRTTKNSGPRQTTAEVAEQQIVPR